MTERPKESESGQFLATLIVGCFGSLYRPSLLVKLSEYEEGDDIVSQLAIILGKLARLGYASLNGLKDWQRVVGSRHGNMFSLNAMFRKGVVT